MTSLFTIVYMALDLYFWVLIVAAVLSWLVAFGVVNTQNRLVYMLSDFLTRVTDPVLRVVRRYINPVGGVDLSPLVVIFGISFIQIVIRNNIPLAYY